MSPKSPSLTADLPEEVALKPKPVVTIHRIPFQKMRTEWLRKQRATEASSQRVPGAEQVLGVGNYVEPPHDPEVFLSFAETNAIHSACLEAKTVDSVGHGWTLNGKEDRTPDEINDEVMKLEDELSELCPDHPFSELLIQARYEMETVGWAGWEVVRTSAGSSKGKISALYPIPAHELRAITEGANRAKRWAQVVDSQKVFYRPFGRDEGINKETGAAEADEQKQANEVIIFRRYSHATRFYGQGKWIACIPSMAEYNAIREYNLSFFGSTGLADLLLMIKSVDPKLGQEIKAQIDKALEEGRGESHYMITVYVGKDDDIKEIVLNRKSGGEKDGSFAGRREDLVKEILMAHNVPPYRVGWAELGSLGGSSAREMLRAYREGSIEPWQTVIEDTLHKTIFGPKGLDLKKRGFRWQLIDLNWEEEEQEAQRVERLTRGGVLSPNDAREELELPRKPDVALDEHYVNGTRISGPHDHGEPPDPGARKPELVTADAPGGGTDPLPFEVVRDRQAPKVDAQREDHVPRVKADFVRHFDEERRVVLDEIGSSGATEGAVNDALARTSESLRRTLRRTYEDVAEDFALSTIGRMAASVAGKTSADDVPVFKARKPADETGLSQLVTDFLGGRAAALQVVDAWQGYVDDWFAQYGGKKVTQIDEVTRSLLMDQIQESVAAGEGLTDTMKRIDELYLDQIIPNRSEVIARTEIIPASNLGAQSAVRSASDQIGLRVERQWISSGNDGRTRPEHLAHDALKVWVPLEKPHEVQFQGAVEKLMFPGDSGLGASAANTIQCRCSEIYRVAPGSSLPPPR